MKPGEFEWSWATGPLLSFIAVIILYISYMHLYKCTSTYAISADRCELVTFNSRKWGRCILDTTVCYPCCQWQLGGFLQVQYWNILNYSLILVSPTN